MPAYRLTFNTLDVNQKPADRVADGNNTLGDVLIPLNTVLVDGATSWDFRTSPHGVTSFVIRFTAATDEGAVEAAEHAIKAVRLPVDGIKVERRGRHYVSVLH